MDDISRKKGLLEFWDSSQLAGHNAAYLEDLYERFVADPNRVAAHWRSFFETLPRVNGAEVEALHSGVRQAFRAMTREPSSQPRPASSLAGNLILLGFAISASVPLMDFVSSVIFHRYIPFQGEPRRSSCWY